MSKKVYESFLTIADGISPKLRDAIREVGPVRIVKRNKDPLANTLCRAIAGQQLSTKAAATIWGRVLAQSGQQNLIDYLRSASIEELRSCGLSGSKAKAMHAIVAAEAEGVLDRSVLSKLSYEERTEQLTSIWGVGQWTTDMMSIFYFGEKDVWPAGDVTVWKTLERLTSKRRKTDKTAERFMPYRTYLALYLYEIADS